MLPDKEMYTLEELFYYLPATFNELGRVSSVSYDTILRIRKHRTRPSKYLMDRLLKGFSEIYRKELTLRNVDLGTIKLSRIT